MLRRIQNTVPRTKRSPNHTSAATSTHPTTVASRERERSVTGTAGSAYGRRSRAIVEAAVAAAVLSGAPSTLHAVVAGRPFWQSTRAAGSLLGRATIWRGLVAHTVLSLGWAVVLAAVLPARRRVAWGTVAGGAIAAADLGLVGRRYPAIAALPTLPHVADHLALGAVVGAVLDRRLTPR